MHLYKTSKGIVLRDNGNSFLLHDGWDELINQHDLNKYLKKMAGSAKTISESEGDNLIDNFLLAPIGNQELWAAGVT